MTLGKLDSLTNTTRSSSKMATRRRFGLVCTGALCMLFCSLLIAEETESTWSRAKETPQQHAARMQWWNSARFGMFVHWGVYSATGGEFRGYMPTNSAEWMMNKARIPIADYKVENVDKFNPTKFDARAFVGLAKQAGMKYLVITAKHHDGFSMFHSKASPYNVVDATPLKRDIMKELAEACQEQGIRFGFYYSQCQDWHHPGGMGNNWDKTIERVSFDQYVREKAVPEIKQLLTEYGPIAIFWWDTPREMSKEAFDRLHSSTELQANIITNDRLGEDHPGDFKTFEAQNPESGSRRRELGGLHAHQRQLGLQEVRHELQVHSHSHPQPGGHCQQRGKLPAECQPDR